MRHSSLLTLSLLLLSACHQAGKAPDPAGGSGTGDGENSLAFADAPGGGATGAADPLVLRAQVALDRAGFSPGVIDGKDSRLYQLALKGYQQAHDLPQTGRLTAGTRAALLPGSAQATRQVVIPAAFAKGPFNPGLPHDMDGMARAPRLGYRSMTEALAERFHTTPGLLYALNGPNTPLGAGRSIRVPDIPNAVTEALPEDNHDWARTLRLLGVSSDQPEADRIVVDKSEGVLRAFDGQGRLIAQFPVTTGSQHDPLPIGDWTVKGEARNPDYQYNPDLFWDAGADETRKRLPPGPNGPVGVVWIDLSKEHYGIHGTPEPQNIGHTESHGCVRLTNWDAARLAQMVTPGTDVVFQP